MPFGGDLEQVNDKIRRLHTTSQTNEEQDRYATIDTRLAKSDLCLPGCQNDNDNHLAKL